MHTHSPLKTSAHLASCWTATARQSRRASPANQPVAAVNDTAKLAATSAWSPIPATATADELAGSRATRAQFTDQMVAHALHLAFDTPTHDTPQLTPTQVLHLSTSTLKQYSFSRSNVVAQHLNARLLTYGRHFLPRDRWYIIAADPAAGAVRWHHDDAALPDVLDVFASGLRRPLQTLGDHAGLEPQDVLRMCDLTSPKDSVLWFPDEARTFPWATVDDPLRYGQPALAPCAHVPEVSA